MSLSDRDRAEGFLDCFSGQSSESEFTKQPMAAYS